MTTENEFQALLDADPDDWQTRLVFADWLQERDDPRAEGYRALGALSLAPESFEANAVLDGRAAHCWWGVKGAPIRRSQLGGDWWGALQGFRIQGRAYRNYNTRREAEDAAALAFAKLPPARRRDLLGTRARAARS